MLNVKNQASLLFWLIVLLVLGGCRPSRPGSAGPPPPPEADAVPAAELADAGEVDTLRLFFWQAPDILNAHLTRSTKDRAAGRMVYEPLATFSDNGNLIPVLALDIPSYENGDLAKNGKSITWRLKDYVLWSDGEPFTAWDVAFTYHFITNRETGATTRGAYNAIESVEVLDDFTIRFNFKDETSIWEWSQQFTGPQGVILPAHIYEPYDNENAADAPDNQLSRVGTGPYIVSHVQARESILFLGNTLVERNRIIFEANPYFREAGKPHFKRVELQGGGTVNGAAEAVLQTDEFDFAWNLQVDAGLLDRGEGEGHGRIETSFGARVERLILNFTNPDPALGDNRSNWSKDYPNPHPFFSDLRVRQAFAHAIDYQALSDLYGKTGCPISSVLPPLDLTCPKGELAHPYDPARAAALLDEAGWTDSDGDGFRDKDGQRMQVLFQAPANSVRQETQAIIRDSLEALGIDVYLKIVDPNSFTDRDPNNTENNRHFYADLQLLTTGTPRPDQSSNMARWRCSAIPNRDNDWQGSNYERYCNPEYDALYAQAIQLEGPLERYERFAELDNIIIQDVVTIPLIYRATVVAVGNDIEGVRLSPWDSELWNIEEWRRVAR